MNTTKTSKHYSTVKYARTDRSYVCNGRTFHQVSVRRFNRSDRQETKRSLRNMK